MSYSRVGILLLLAQVGCSAGSPSALTKKAGPGTGTGTGTGDDAGDVSLDAATASYDASTDPGSDHDGSSPSHDDASANDAGTNDDAATTDDASTTNDATTNGTDSSLPHNDSGSDACTSNCTPVDASSGQDSAVPYDAGPVNPTLVLSTLAAHQTGRSGDDLVLSVQGSDVAQSAYALDITLYDVFNHPLAAFKSWSGTSAQRTVLFDDTSAAGLSTFARSVTLRGFMKANPNITKVTAMLVDSAGHSNSLTTTVALQTVRNLNQSCDVNVVTNRCSSGLSCDPNSHVCASPSAPQIAKFVYVTAPSGARMLFAGADPADDISSMHLEFLSQSGQPVLIDVNGDQNLKNSFDEPIVGASKLGSFFFAVQATQTFSSLVPQLGATPSGSSSGTGARLTATLQAPTVAATGGACDVRGFASCQSGDACVQSQASQPAGTCVHIPAALAAASQAAPTLDASNPNAFVTGYATGTNLWGDAPSDCVPSGLTGLPEGIVKLHVPQPIQSLTISTDNEETTFSSKLALFVLEGTGSGVGTQSLGCNYGSPATVTLSNLSAGDYTLVVNSATIGDGNFGISFK